MPIKNFPFDYQLDNTASAPACLKLIAIHFGKDYSLHHLRDLCGITGNEATFLDLCYGAEKIGLHALTVKTDLQNLQINIPLPCIIQWQNSHFVVVYKTTKSKIYVSDPTIGLISYSLPDFQKGWYKYGEKAGEILVVEPMASFRQWDIKRPTGRQKTTESVFSYFAPFRKNLAALFVVMILATALQGILPFISKAVIDIGTMTRDLEYIDILLIANVILIASITISNVVRDWLLVHISARVTIALVSDYLVKIMQLPVTFFENKVIGDILQRAQDQERIRNFIMNYSLSLVFSSLTFFTFSIILLIYNQIIFFIFIGGSILYIFWVLAFLKVSKKYDLEYFALASQNQSYWVETVGSIQDIKINNYEKQKRWKLETIQAKQCQTNLKLLNISNAQNIGAHFIQSIQNLAITFYCARAVLSGEITLGTMFSVLFMIGMLNAPVTQFISFITLGQNVKISCSRINEIHQLNDEEDGDASNKMSIPENKTLFIQNLSFQYSPTSPFVLKHIHIAIPQGKITAIVGDSGSGKSTLLKLLIRLHQPTFGAIMIDNIAISNISLRDWRNHCGVVMQDGKIFSDTILNNIVLDDEDINYEQLRKVVRDAHIGSEIEQLPQGYLTKIGEAGWGLSGGQKQRILIARALYRAPAFLFLDEATNALDSISEQMIINALAHNFEKRTVVVIAHRLSTIINADQIVVMKEGMIIEVGNHQSLMKKEGHYYDLINKQIEILPSKSSIKKGKSAAEV